jgi:hypothetical protein
MARILSSFLILLAFSSCYRNVPGPEFDESLIVSPDSMVSILVDIHLLEGIVNVGKLKDTALADLSENTLNLILNKHHLDRKAFEENVHFYTYHTEELDKIYDRVIINLSKLESEMSVGKDTLN